MPARKPRGKIVGNQFSAALVEPAIMTLLQNVAGVLTARGAPAYLVGGFVRDALLGREMADVDIAVAGDALAAGQALAEALGGTYVLLDAENRIARVVVKGHPDVDLSSFTGTIEQDLARRDFTIDAMALDLPGLMAGAVSVLDPFHGMDDLDHGIVRSVSETSLPDDPVRLLRAVRLAGELGFAIAHKTEGQVRRSAGLLARVAGERVREELLRIFDVSRGGRFLSTLDELGLLDVLFPEMTPTRGVTQPAEHHWDVFQHSVHAVSAVDFILHQGVWDYPAPGVLEAVPWSEACAQHFETFVGGGCTRRTLLKLVAFLHDVAKPQTKALDETGRMRFLGHNEQGEAVVMQILQRLRFSTRETKLAGIMVKYHLRPTQIGEPPSARAIYRYFRDTGDAGVDILYLSLADHLATRGPDLIPSHWREHAGNVRYVLDEHYRRVVTVPPQKLVDGNDIMDVFRLAPGKRVGELLEMVREAQAAGELTTRQEALDYIRWKVRTP